MKLKELPAINVVYKSKELEMMRRDDIIQRIQEFLTKGDSANSDRYEQFRNLNNRSEDVKYAYVVYLYGDGGIGKTCLCKMVRNQISVLSQADQVVHRIYYDLAKNNDVISKLVDISMLIKDSFDNSEMFLLFDYAYNVYISKVGEQSNHFSKSVEVNDVVTTALSIASCIPGLSNAVDVVNAGKAVISLIHKYRKDKHILENFHVIDNIPLEDLKERLCQYFAKDLNTYFNQNPEERLVIILDTFENFLYRDPKDGRIFNPTDWLFGSNGIVCLLQNTFWVIAGREEIDWKTYDSESHEISFLNVHVEKPAKKLVTDYLVQTGLESYSAEEIAKSTSCYPLHFGMCIDLFFKLWNESLQENYGNNKSLNDCKPSIGEVTEIIKMVKNSSIVSDRVLGYFNKQEKDVIFTLACLKRWTDELLSEVIWKYYPSNFTFYESIKGFFFIKKYGTAYEFQTDALCEIVTNCPNLIKRNLISSITTALDEGTSLRFLLIQSLSHITLYYQTEANPWEKVVWYLYGGMFSLLQSNMFGTVDELCARLFNLIKIANQSDKTDNVFKFSIWVWQYVSATVQNSLDNPNSVIVNYFHISENVPKRKYTPDECLKEMEKLLKDLSPDELSIEYRWAVEAVYRWLTQYELYQEAYVIVQLILSRFSQPLEKAFPKYKPYQAAIMADAKLCYLSWNKYEGNAEHPHSISIENKEIVLQKLAVLIDYINENAKNLRTHLKDLIEAYLKLIKLPHIFHTKEHIIISDPYENSGKDFNRFFYLYKRLVNPNDVQELMDLKILECWISESDRNYDAVVKLAFQGIYLLVSEYGVDLERLNVFEWLTHYIAIAYVRVSVETDLLLAEREVLSYQRLFNTVVSIFCKTMNLKYYDIIYNFGVISKNLFKKPESGWIRFIFQLSNRINKSLLERIALMILYKAYSYYYNLNFYDFVKEETGELVIDKDNSSMAEFSILDLTDVNLLLGFASNTNQILYTILNKLNEVYNNSDEKEKLKVSNLLVQFIAEIFYDGIQWPEKKSSLIYSILYSIDKNLIKMIDNDVRIALMGQEANYSCFRDLDGWQSNLDLDLDKKINQYVLDLLYNCMLNEDFLITKDFYIAVGKALEHFKRNFPCETGKNLVKFLDYVTATKDFKSASLSRFSEEYVYYWKTHSVKFLNYADFSEEPEIRKALVKYGVFRPEEMLFSYFRQLLEDLLEIGDYDFIRSWYKIYANGKMSTHADRVYYEPIVFQHGKDAIFEALNKIETDIGQLPKTDGFQRRDASRRRALLKGYYDYKTKEEFVSFVKDILEDLIEDVGYAISLGFFEETLKLVAATNDSILVRSYVLKVKESGYVVLRKIIFNYGIIAEFVKPEEIL